MSGKKLNPKFAPPPGAEIVGSVRASGDRNSDRRRRYRVYFVSAPDGRKRWGCECASYKYGHGRPCKHMVALFLASASVRQGADPAQFERTQGVRWTAQAVQYMRKTS